MPITSQGNTPIQINPIDQQPDIAVGVGLPIDASNGAALSSTFTTKDQIRANILNLLSTIPGERINQPEFGSKLWQFLFEPNTDDLRIDKIAVEIKSSLATWIPEVRVTQVVWAKEGSHQRARETDLNRIGVKVHYEILGTSINDSVAVTTPTV